MGETAADGSQMGSYSAAYFLTAVTIAANVTFGRRFSRFHPCVDVSFSAAVSFLLPASRRSLQWESLRMHAAFLITYLAAGRQIYDFHGNEICFLLLRCVLSKDIVTFFVVFFFLSTAFS